MVERKTEQHNVTKLKKVNGKMVNGFRYYRALESVSILALVLFYSSYHLPMPDPSPSTLTV